MPHCLLVVLPHCVLVATKVCIQTVPTLHVGRLQYSEASVCMDFFITITYILYLYKEVHGVWKDIARLERLTSDASCWLGGYVYMSMATITYTTLVFQLHSLIH